MRDRSYKENGKCIFTGKTVILLVPMNLSKLCQNNTIPISSKGAIMFRAAKSSGFGLESIRIMMEHLPILSLRAGLFLTALILVRFPVSSAISFNCRERVGWDRCGASAAAEIFCSLVTARKY